MSGYFRDRVQGAGAIAANARAPRSAPAPRLRRGVGYVAAGAVRIDDKGGDSGGEGGPAPRPGTSFRAPVRTGVKATRGTVKPPAPIAPTGGRGPIAAQPVKPKMLPSSITALFEPGPVAPVRGRGGAPAPRVGKAPRASATVSNLFAEPPPIIPVLVSTASGVKQAALVSGGGAAYNPTPKGTPNYGGLLVNPKIDDGGGEDELEVSPTTAVAPKGGAKLWLALGLGGTAAYLAYRHFSKQKGKR